MSPPPPVTLRTPRLLLRPSDGRDAARAFEIRGNPAVARMLSLARHPPSLAEMQEWFADFPRQWRDCEAFRFAILLEGRMIGLIDLDDISVAGDEAEVGCWLDELSWSSGYASEAGQALFGFAFGTLGLTRLRAGHAADNLASAAIVEAFGFRHIGDLLVPSLSRGEEVLQRRYLLERP